MLVEKYMVQQYGEQWQPGCWNKQLRLGLKAGKGKSK
jgi:hypothetical protein